MDFWVVLGAVGSVASVVGVLLPAQSKSQRVVHVSYGLAIVAITCVAAWYWQKNNRVENVERAATTLVAGARMDYTNEGFIQAALAFLEKNKDLYPESYARAQRLVEDCNCLGGKNG